MKILCTTTFLDGQRRFEKDDVCTVQDEDGARFCAQGWATSEGVPQGVPASSEVSLDIHSARATVRDSQGA
jgi:hypothetical protein